MFTLDDTELVKKVLSEHELSRDDFFLLVLNCWMKKLGDEGKPLKPFFKQLLILHREKKIPNFSTIDRTRRKLQKEYPELQGRNYDKNQEYQYEFKDKVKDWNV